MNEQGGYGYDDRVLRAELSAQVEREIGKLRSEFDRGISALRAFGLEEMQKRVDDINERFRDHKSDRQAETQMVADRLAKFILEYTDRAATLAEWRRNKDAQIGLLISSAWGILILLISVLTGIIVKWK